MSKKSIIALKRTIQISFFSFVVFLATSCEDEPQILGLNLIPDSDKVTAQYVDTFTVFAQTEKMDSVYTGYNSVVPLGNLHDPIFGFTKSNILAEFYPYDIDSLHDDNPVYDSVKLVLRPYRFHGDSLADVTLNVYEYLNSLPGDSLLYSNLIIDRANLSQIGQGKYQLNDEEIKIFLDDEFGRRLLSPSENTFEEVIDSFELFNNNFHGFYFETDDHSSKGGINYFRFSSIQEAFISLHYHYEADSTVNVTEFYTFHSGYGMYKNVCLYEHDYSNANFDPFSGVQDSIVYVQSLAGTKGILKIPGLDALNDQGTISVSSAKLLLPLEDYDKSKYVFLPPAHIGITAIASDNSEFDLDDNSYIYYDQNSGTVGNNYIKGTIDDSSRYELNITRHIESILNKEIENLGFNIFVANDLMNHNTQTLNRVVLTSHLNSNPIKLKVVYTKLSN